MDKKQTMINKILLSIAVVLLFASCDKQDEKTELSADYMLFGHFYGFCAGEQCIEIFKVSDSELWEDTKDEYPSQQQLYAGDYIQLDQNKFELVKSLIEKVPFELTLEKNHVIGAPDASDGGGIYIAIIKDGDVQFWLIDQFDHNIPEYLRPFKDLVNQSIDLISD